jgi:SWI/SNF-related matrix-associated actin-dependent regulator 1 of chromatin subfamily A
MPGAILADEPGLGKTGQTITAADAVGGKILVVCPASLKINWFRELNAFGFWKRKIHVVNSGTSRIPKNTDTVVVNYDLLPRKQVCERLRDFEPYVFIEDEAHRLKNPASRRSIAALGRLSDRVGSIAESAQFWWAITGTPAPNHPGELWAILRSHCPQALYDPRTGQPMSRLAFEARYCVTRETIFGSKIIGGKNLPELRARFEPFIKRRLVQDVLSQMPPLQIEHFPLSVNDSATTQLDRHARELGLLRAGADEEDGDDVLEAAQADMGAGATIRREIGVLKAPFVADMVLEDLEAGQPKIVVFAYHVEVIQTLLHKLHNHGAVAVYGATSQAQRQYNIDRFQSDPGCRIIIGQITALSEGVTLTAADMMYFAEQSWVPTENAQAVRRIYRIGQKSRCLIKVPFLPLSIDESIQAALTRKMKTLLDLGF